MILHTLEIYKLRFNMQNFIFKRKKQGNPLKRGLFFFYITKTTQTSNFRKLKSQTVQAALIYSNERILE